MRTTSRLCSILAMAGVLLVGGPLLGAATAQEAAADEPELVAVGSGRLEGRCFIEVHLDGTWPPPTSIEEWVIALTAEGTGGTISIRNFFSLAQGRSGVSATGPEGDFVVDNLLLEDGATAYEWNCTAAPATVEVLLEYGDGAGTTLLADRIPATPFSDVPRGPGDVPEDELTVDERDDLLAPDDGGGVDPADEPEGSSGGMGAGGALLIVLGVVALGVVGYLALASRGDGDETASSPEPQPEPQPEPEPESEPESDGEGDGDGDEG